MLSTEIIVIYSSRSSYIVQFCCVGLTTASSSFVGLSSVSSSVGLNSVSSSVLLSSVYPSVRLNFVTSSVHHWVRTLLGGSNHEVHKICGSLLKQWVTHWCEARQENRVSFLLLPLYMIMTTSWLAFLSLGGSIC